MQKLTKKSILLTSRTQPPYFSYHQQQFQPVPNQILAKVLYFSVDPVMKIWLNGARTNFRRAQIQQTFNCFGLAQIIHGNQQYEKGQYYFGNTGTTNYVVIDENRSKQMFSVPRELVEMYGSGNFLYLINNGLAAYAGYEILSPKPSDTTVVSTAAGATGLLFCQLLKKKGHQMICLSSASKLPILTKYTNIIVDYKNKQNLAKTLQQNKFNCYFDNVGDEMLDLILEHIENDGRIALCGAISNYTDYEGRGIRNSFKIIEKRLKIEGLTFFGMFSKIEKIFKQYEGIDLKTAQITMQEFPQTFQQLLSSGNQIIGKILVKP